MRWAELCVGDQLRGADGRHEVVTRIRWVGPDDHHSHTCVTTMNEAWELTDIIAYGDEEPQDVWVLDPTGQTP